MKVYVVSIIKDSERRDPDKDWSEGKIIKRVNAGVLRVFAGRAGAKKYIEDFYNDSATNNATLETKEKKDGSTFSASIFDMIEEHDGSATWDGIDLSGYTTKIRIKVVQMEVAQDDDECTLDDDLYDIFVGEERDRAYEI